jgi:hypothetical protein
MRYWLSEHRADVLITDRPAVAMTLRDQIAGGEVG